MSAPKPRVLLVEGQEDMRVLPQLLESAGIDWGPRGGEIVRIEQFGGIEELLARGQIEAQIRSPGLERIGIVADANADRAHRWEQIRDRLSVYASLPASLAAEGIVHTEPDLPRVGVWLMPDNVASGMLETLLMSLRVGRDEIREHAAAAVATARTLGAPFADAHRDKAELHTWLAWQDPPGQQMHIAIKARHIVAPQTAPFVGWYRRLFSSD